MKRVWWLALVALGMACACFLLYRVMHTGRLGAWCLGRPKLASGEWNLQLLDRARDPNLALLGRGRYRTDISGECYLVRCDFEVPDTASDQGEWWADQRTHCAGDELGFTVRYRDLSGFSVPDALDRIEVRIEKDGKSIYSGLVTRSTTCPEAGLCVFPSPQLAP